MGNFLFFIIGLVFTIKIANVKGVKFLLPSEKSFSTRSESKSSTSTSTSSSSSSSDSTDNYGEKEKEKFKCFNQELSSTSETCGRFKKLKKDDDKIKQKKKRRNNEKVTKLKKKTYKTKKYEKRFKAGNQQYEQRSGTGFVYNRAWQEQMEKIESQFTGEVGSLKLNGFMESFEKKTQGIINEPLNVGWWLISFGEGNSKSKSIFKFKSHQSIKVSVVDLFCRGDSFSVLNGDRLIAQSSRTLPDRECWERIINPDEALSDGRWSSVNFDLESGDHKIEIKTIDSPMTGGLAAIRFDTLNSLRKVSRTNICRGYNGLLIITARLTKLEAEERCNEFKSDLAAVDSDNQQEVFKSLENCMSRESNETVWAYKGNTNNIEPYSIMGFKSVAKERDEELRFALCRVRTSS